MDFKPGYYLFDGRICFITDIEFNTYVVKDRFYLWETDTGALVLLASIGSDYTKVAISANDLSDLEKIIYGLD